MLPMVVKLKTARKPKMCFNMLFTCPQTQFMHCDGGPVSRVRRTGCWCVCARGGEVNCATSWCDRSSKPLPCISSGGFSWADMSLAEKKQEVSSKSSRSTSGSLSRPPSSDMPLENSSTPVWRSMMTVKSTSASRLEVELTVMLEHLRSMPRCVSFRYNVSLSWSSSEAEPSRRSHGSLWTRDRDTVSHSGQLDTTARAETWVWMEVITDERWEQERWRTPSFLIREKSIWPPLIDRVKMTSYIYLACVALLFQHVQYCNFCVKRW